MNLETLKSNWKNLLTKGFKKIFAELDTQLLSGTEAENQYLQIKGRFNGLEQSIILGTIMHQDAEILRNQIRNGLMAFLSALEENDIKGGIKSQKTLLQTNFLSIENQMEEINDKIHQLIGVNTPQGETLLKEVIKANVQIEEDLGLIHLVNCDRATVKESFWNAFDEKVDNELPFQFYFFVGCPTQMPHSFSERMIYEIIDSELDDEESAIHRVIDQDNGRIKIEDLPQGRKLERSQKEFKKYFSKRFEFQQEDSFDKYLEFGLPRLEYEYISFVFEMGEAKWKKDTAAYIDWIVNSFNTNKKELPTFIFFFNIRLDYVHDEDNRTPKHQSILDELNVIVNKYAKATFFNPLSPIHEKDVKDWLHEIGERSPTNQDIILDAFVKGLYDKDGRKKKQYQDKKLLDMDDVQRLQKIIYDFYYESYEE
jgi:hypothetical protein